MEVLHSKSKLGVSNMKTLTILAAVLLLAGIVSPNPVQDKLPEWLPEINIDWEQIKEKIQEVVEKIREFVESIDLENLPIEQIKEVLKDLAERIKEILQGLERPPWVEDIEWEQIKEKIQEVVEKIREFVESLDLENLTIEQIKEALQELANRIREILQNILDQINTPVPGQQSSIQQYPSTAQIEYGYGPVWIQACSGSIITNFHILSSVRCFTGLRLGLRFRRARVGSGQRNVGGVIHEFGSVVLHPDFGSSADGLFDSDIALGRLSAPVAFTPNVQSIVITVPDIEIPASLPVTLTGYGRTAAGGLRPANGDLHSVDLVSIDKATCTATWADLPIFGDRTVVGPNNFCAGRIETGGRNFDMRDVGSPIVSNNILIGVLSWGNLFGNQKYPLVATSVSPFTNWIIENAV